MGYMVSDAVRMLQRRLGQFFFHDWERCARLLGLDIMYTDLLPKRMPSCLYDGAIILSSKLSPYLAALHAWHEIGHRVLHFGNREFWIGRPQGRVTVAKMERQAWEFAFTFPVWLAE